MPFSAEDKHAIKLLWQTKQYGAKHLISTFPDKQWSLGDLKKLSRKINDTGTVDRRLAPGSGHPRTARVADKIDKGDFIPLDLWSPNSPDLNPVDYKIWDVLRERVYKTSIKDVNKQRRRITEKWNKLD